LRIIDIKITKENNLWLEFDNQHYRLVNTAKNDIFEDLLNQDFKNATIEQEGKVLSFGHTIKIKSNVLYELSKNVDEVLKGSSKRKTKFPVMNQITHLSDETISNAMRRLRNEQQKVLDRLNKHI
jgi:hypothetical protein